MFGKIFTKKYKNMDNISIITKNVVFANDKLPIICTANKDINNITTLNINENELPFKDFASNAYLSSIIKGLYGKKIKFKGTGNNTSLQQKFHFEEIGIEFIYDKIPQKIGISENSRKQTYKSK